MIDLATETVLSLPEAARRIPSFRAGRKTHVATVCRWAKHGIRGIKLDSARVGGRVVTSAEALQRFSDALSADPDPSNPSAPIPPAPRGQVARRKAVEKADRELAEAGF